MECIRDFNTVTLISEMIGGSNDIKNLWPESYAEPNGAHTKDKLENRLHELVCNNTITLQAARLVLVLIGGLVIKNI